MDPGGSASRRPGPSAISTSFRSPLPSPLASPTLSSAGADGLNRRLSWSRPQDDVFTARPVDMDPSQMRSLAPPSWARLVSDDGMEEYDLGLREPRRSCDSPPAQGWKGGGQGLRPFFHQADSTASFDSQQSTGSPPSGVEDERDRDRTPFASSSSRIYPSAQLSSTRKSKRVYDEHGLARGPRNLAASVARSPTFRAVSSTLRKASVRVSTLMSPGQAREDGRTRIPDEDDEESKGTRGFEMDPFQPPPSAVDAGRPEGLPPELKTGLRGRTLCLFGVDNVIRKACYAALNWPYVSSPTRKGGRLMIQVDRDRYSGSNHPLRCDPHNSIFFATVRTTPRQRLLPELGRLGDPHHLLHLHVSSLGPAQEVFHQADYQLRDGR